MKKRTAGLLFIMAFSLSVVGCGGNSAEPKQDETQTQEQEAEQEQEQEKTEADAETEQEENEEEGSQNDYSDIIGKEFENDDIYIKVESTEQTFGIYEDEWEEAYGQLTADQDIPLYCDGGFQIGHIKTGATIDITEHGIYDGVPGAYYRFQNPISDTPFEYLYISYLDCDPQSFKIETESSIKESELTQETQEAQEESPDLYDEILSKVGYDKDKTYTTDEYIEVLTKIIEEMGKENNPDLNQDFNDSMSGKELDGYRVSMMYKVSDFEDHEKTLENTKDFMSYADWIFVDYESVTEFSLLTGKKDDGKETVNLIVKLVTE